ncbi:PfkB family carbohydrate kinase [Loktanella sp. DJP18]|uniref:PfkB family carbohydrate kinase n=1 Tax=Loktanella sp. DJP18 TaxID=3409788 RepID=UPI003BB59924
MSFRIVCIGEPLAEISRSDAGFGVGFGGDTLNTAIYCARSVAGLEIAVDYVTAVGQDTLSQGILDLLAKEGVETDHITRDPARQVGIYAIETDPEGERSFHYWRDTSAARQMFNAGGSPHLAAIAAADLIYLSGISVAILSPQARDRLWTALSGARRRGALIAFDSNYRPRLWDSTETARTQIDRFWHVTDIALPSADDEAALFGDSDPASIIARLRAAGATTGAVKRGAQGAMSLQTGIALRDASAADMVIDTTGAGDSFNGAYLAARAGGLPEPQALALAHDLACRVVGHRGALLPVRPPARPRRMASVIRLRPEHLAEYTRLHADVWPGVLARLRASHVTNYSIYLKRPEMLMFGYFEYTGKDFAADDAAIAADPVTQNWWAVCGPMQDPFDTRTPGEWWAGMEEVFHVD